MSDSASQWLLEQIRANSGLASLWCLDEHAQSDDLPVDPSLNVITNRWDQAERTRHAGLNTQFSDFDFSPWADASLDQVFYRVSKEKPVVHHLINEAGRVLKPGGELVLCGHKTEGAKTYIEKAAAYLGQRQKAKKVGQLYVGRLRRSDALSLPLDDSDYTTPRRIFNDNDIEFFSKPGLYGWQKRDKGSALLWELAAPRLQSSGANSL